jgi:hypothetical protein
LNSQLPHSFFPDSISVLPVQTAQLLEATQENGQVMTEGTQWQPEPSMPLFCLSQALLHSHDGLHALAKDNNTANETFQKVMSQSPNIPPAQRVRALQRPILTFLADAPDVRIQ